MSKILGAAHVPVLVRKNLKTCFFSCDNSRNPAIIATVSDDPKRLLPWPVGSLDAWVAVWTPGIVGVVGAIGSTSLVEDRWNVIQRIRHLLVGGDWNMTSIFSRNSWEWNNHPNRLIFFRGVGLKPPSNLGIIPMTGIGRVSFALMDHPSSRRFFFW